MRFLNNGVFLGRDHGLDTEIRKHPSTFRCVVCSVTIHSSDRGRNKRTHRYHHRAICHVVFCEALHHDFVGVRANSEMNFSPRPPLSFAVLAHFPLTLSIDLKASRVEDKVRGPLFAQPFNQGSQAGTSTTYPAVVGYGEGELK